MHMYQQGRLTHSIGTVLTHANLKGHLVGNLKGYSGSGVKGVYIALHDQTRTFTLQTHY